MSGNLLDLWREFNAARDISASTALSNRPAACPIPPGETQGRVEYAVYNNFFITRPKFWNTGPLRAFYDFVQERDGFLQQAIGDAEFHTVAVCLLQGEKGQANVERFGAGFSYRHKLEGPMVPVEANGLFGGLSVADSEPKQQLIFWTDFLENVGCHALQEKLPPIEQSYRIS